MSQKNKEISPTSDHLLVVDDDTRIRELLQRFLMEHGFRVTLAKDAAQARAHLKGLTFDLVILDVMMPGESGFDFATSLRAESDVPILMLTARGDAEDRIEGLERGVDDYLPKPFEPRELLLRIHSIMRRSRQQIEPLEEIRMGACRFNIKRGELWRNDSPVRLTTAEVTLLRYMATNTDRALSRLELSEKTGASLERSIDVQVTRLRRKIESEPKMPLYLQTVRGIGYMLVPD